MMSIMHLDHTTFIPLSFYNIHNVMYVQCHVYIISVLLFILKISWNQVCEGKQKSMIYGSTSNLRLKFCVLALINQH